MLPKWIVGEVGYLLATAGFLLLVAEWWSAFQAQGNSLARNALKTDLIDWRNAQDTTHGTAEETRKAIVRRMQTEVARLSDVDDRKMFRSYVDQLEETDLRDEGYIAALSASFEAATVIEDEARRPNRAWLVVIAVGLVLIGNLGQMISTAPPSRLFCDGNEWSLSCSPPCDCQPHKA